MKYYLQTFILWLAAFACAWCLALQAYGWGILFGGFGLVLAVLHADELEWADHMDQRVTKVMAEVRDLLRQEGTDAHPKA